jgi:hypothetical protein
MRDTDESSRRTCPGGFDYAGHVCDDGNKCPPGYPRLTESGWELSDPAAGPLPRLEGDTLFYDRRYKRP